MNEFLELEEAVEILKRLYGKNQEGWRGASGIAGNGLIEYVIKGPDISVHIVHDSPYFIPLMSKISTLPKPWRPAGKAVMLDEPPTGVKFGPTPYGLRAVSRKTFEGMLNILGMMFHGLPREEVDAHYRRLFEKHVKQPVVGYDGLITPVITAGPYVDQLNLADISEEQRELRAKLIDDTIRMRRRGIIV